MFEPILALALAVAVWGMNVFMERHHLRHVRLAIVAVATLGMLAFAIARPDHRMITLVFVIVGAVGAIKLQRKIWAEQRG
jgi:hypothetical protein